MVTLQTRWKCGWDVTTDHLFCFHPRTVAEWAVRVTVQFCRNKNKSIWRMVPASILTHLGNGCWFSKSYFFWPLFGKDATPDQNSQLKLEGPTQRDGSLCSYLVWQKGGNPNFHVDSLASAKGGRNTHPKYHLSFCLELVLTWKTQRTISFKASVAGFRGKDDTN